MGSGTANLHPFGDLFHGLLLGNKLLRATDHQGDENGIQGGGHQVGLTMPASLARASGVSPVNGILAWMVVFSVEESPQFILIVDWGLIQHQSKVKL